VATAVSGTGDFLYSIALVVYLIDETGSAGWVAAAAIARMVTFTVLGPIGGVIADRFDRRRLMVILDGSRAVVMSLIVVAIAAGGPPLVVLGLVVVSAALTTPYRPAGVAATPLLVSEDDLAAANAAEASVGQIAWFAGPALGAALVALSGPELAFGANAVTFALSGVLVAGIGNVGTGAPRRAERDPAERAMRQLVEGTRAMRQVAGLAAMTLLVVAVLFAYGIEQVVQVFVVRDRLDLDADAVGVLIACTGVGGLLAVPFSARLARHRHGGRLLAASGVLMGAPLALLSIAGSLPVAGALMVVEGVGNITFDVLLMTLLQRLCPERLIGRVFSLQDTSGALAQLLGTIAAPVLVTSVDLEAALLIGGGSLVAASLALVPALHAISVRTEAERERLAPVAAELGELGILGDASQAARERIARSTTTRSVVAGSVVFREGDPSTDLFVIRSGSVAISTEAQGWVRRLGPGDWFGEIGLIRHLDRTATVAAITDLELLVIPGSVFLDAVSGADVLPVALGSTMNLRLARTHPHLVDAQP
jgi:MFS family permease